MTCLRRGSCPDRISGTLGRYDGPGSGDDQATSLAASPSGSAVFVTGPSPGTASGLDYATVAYRS